jgi:SAM-dependent methyltransferase
MATNPQSTHWNAEVYERIGTPMRCWAQAVIDDLHLRGDETVLDAGCGSGSVTFDLLERLPSGRIYAVDSSPEMISKITQAINTSQPHRLRAARAGRRCLLERCPSLDPGRRRALRLSLPGDEAGRPLSGAVWRRTEHCSPDSGYGGRRAARAICGIPRHG